MNGGATWEELHDQIAALLPLVDPATAGVAHAALLEGRRVRYENWPAGADLLAALHDLDQAQAQTSAGSAARHLLLATRDLLHGLLPVAALPPHLISAWLELEAARSLLIPPLPAVTEKASPAEPSPPPLIIRPPSQELAAV